MVRAKAILVSRANNRILIAVATAAWIGFLAYVVTTPTLPRIPLVSVTTLSSGGHYVTHVVLALLVYLLVSSSPSRLSGRARAAAVAALLSAGIGMMAEGLQLALSDRDANASDFQLDAAGAGSGAAVALLVDSLRGGQRLLKGVATLAVFGLIGGFSASYVIWGQSLPQVSHHWHAPYTIMVCGSTLPPLPGTGGGVHTHGEGIIHIHAEHLSPQEHENANLGLFFGTSGGELTDTSFTLPSGQTYANGDLCPNGRPGKVAVWVNDVRVEQPNTYVIRDRDLIVIEFRTP